MIVRSNKHFGDSKALSGFDNSKVILIAGGLDRGNEFDELVPDITGSQENDYFGRIRSLVPSNVPLRKQVYLILMLKM